VTKVVFVRFSCALHRHRNVVTDDFRFIGKVSGVAED
jgi:hypothetical protein